MSGINIAGAGLAGLSAAISLAKTGIECNLISLQPSERAQSVLAAGGINASMNTMGENDTTEEHFADTMKGGVFLADPNAVEKLVNGATEIVEELLGIGVPLHREQGRLVQRSFGGQKKKRTAYAKSSTGKVIMTGLTDEARKYEAAGLIHRFPHHKITDILIDNGECKGLMMYDAYTDEAYHCEGAVILASGGLNGLFAGETTGTVYNRGDLTASAFAGGAEAANLEFIQYHPTTVEISGKRLLISEAARGEGGRLLAIRGGKRWYFMEELYPELGNLMPRDVVSREIVNVLKRDDCGGKVYLDMTMLSAETWNTKLCDTRKEIKDYLNIDPAKELIELRPGIHFFMGGVNADENHRTNIKGLYAAGECACIYHGANRLGGNSMLGAIYGGKTAAKSAAEDNIKGLVKRLGRVSDSEKKNSEISAVTEKKLTEILMDGLGIIRDGASIKSALEKTDELLNTSLTKAERNRVMLAKAMLLSALGRRESRGAHTRNDYPDRDDEHYRRTTVSAVRDGEIWLEYRSLPERRSASEI